ncbi:nucleotidyl transferase AbiEii/AbiGii toxin family protein [Paracoccus benzoatiresistens]|uniref:Nucleotidyl transferase AbiEii/AbiGii toxin family protein n=1 Tax=Paracoccus benzoatiresistens TaxID=2997341 RepID=A0ABT4JCK1_9RHOB|nr:nucleotidyl transferase AbiEii/AbiGii toxin family protein [Paracoccus sp. EF6]MCZ0964460.1 nucleotidyl transferase AbiEii/AbiGii toxin family protein [Paracoccus sp. EF6]
MAIVDQANAIGIAMNDWTFGGGTALMLQIGHRDSHDIDLFVSDAQYLPFLNPETQGFELSLVPSGYETDGTRALKIVFEGVGEVDFICCPAVTDHPFERAIVNGREVNRETPAEILGKKIVFRGATLQPRDMFDIAAAAVVLGEDALVTSLKPLAEASGVALKVARGMNPDLARTVMSRLMAHPDYQDLYLTAQDVACRVLQRVAGETS